MGFAVAQGENGTQAVTRVLDITGLRTELPVHADRERAIAAVANGSASA